MTFSVYKATNRVNGKVYVGCTTSHIEVRWYKHIKAALNPNFQPYTPCYALYLDIQRYGAENFSLELLDTCPDRGSMLGRERHWMEELSSFIPHGYNVPTRRLTDEQLAIVRFNACGLSRKTYAALFGVSRSVIGVAQTGRGGMPADPYAYITRQHLPADISAYLHAFGYATPEEMEIFTSIGESG